VLSPDDDLMLSKYVMRIISNCNFLLHTCETVGVMHMYVLLKTQT
jgi:hypothetical protein